MTENTNIVETKHTFTCCICGEEVEGFGNNPYPIADDEESRCCDDCDARFVIPARINARRDSKANFVADIENQAVELELLAKSLDWFMGNLEAKPDPEEVEHAALMVGIIHEKATSLRITAEISNM